MTKSQAKNLISTQKAKLDQSLNRDETWIFQTCSIIESIFGRQSVEYSFISQFQFGTWRQPGESKEKVLERLDDKDKKLKRYLDNCIDTVDHKGLYKAPKTNFLSDLGTSSLLSYLLGAALVVFSAGIFLGGYFAKVDSQEIRSENKVLRDSLFLAKSLSKNSDTTTYKHPEKKNTNNNQP